MQTEPYTEVFGQSKELGRTGGCRNPAKSCALTSIRSSQRMGSPFKVPTKHHKGQQQPCSSVLKPICKITVIGDKTVKICLLLADSLVSLLALMNFNILDPHHHPPTPTPYFVADPVTATAHVKQPSCLHPHHPHSSSSSWEEALRELLVKEALRELRAIPIRWT